MSATLRWKIFTNLNRGKLAQERESLHSFHLSMAIIRVTNRLACRTPNPKETSTSALEESKTTIFDLARPLRILLAIIIQGQARIRMPRPLFLEVELSLARHLQSRPWKTSKKTRHPTLLPVRPSVPVRPLSRCLARTDGLAGARACTSYQMRGIARMASSTGVARSSNVSRIW